ncbi:hypothetical protein RI129_001899 [Pyrocoelia pectoralis]|uniref:Sodium-coupled monocarboxylate transporter 1 n=1 Tax=Pyrocoelia pectoralis TaxID=417401 RepID=A0AAN7ZKB5_9COLE
MGAQLLTWIDYTCFFVITSFTCLIGLYFGVYIRPKTTNEYLFGGKHMKWLLICLSLAAGGLSAYTIIGYTTEMYLHGTQLILICVSTILEDMINYNLFFPVFSILQVRNIYQYLEMRFSRYLKNLVVFIEILKVMFTLSLVIYSPSLIFSQASGVNSHVMAIIMMSVCVSYTSLGGVKAVVWADTLQLTITFSTLFASVIMGTISIGGADILLKRASDGQRLPIVDVNPDPTLRMSFWTIIFGYTITWCTLTSTSPSEIQRYLSVPTSALKRLFITHSLTFIAIKVTCMVLALVIYGKYFDCDPISTGEVKKSDQILAYFMTDVTSHIPGFNGIFVAAMFGSSLSIATTLLNTLSGVIYFEVTHWFVPKRYLKAGSELIFMKIFVVVLGIISLGLMYALENVGTIFETFYSLRGISSGAVFGIFLLGLIIPFANVKGAFCGCIASFVLMSVIIVHSQIYIRNGLIKYVPKPLHTFGCNNTIPKNFTTSLFTAPINTNTVDEQPFWLFKISFQYYDLIGTIISVIVGSVISWLTKRKDDPLVNPEHLSPIVRMFYKPHCDDDAQPQESKLLNETERNQSTSLH